MLNIPTFFHIQSGCPGEQGAPSVDPTQLRGVDVNALQATKRVRTREEVAEVLGVPQTTSWEHLIYYYLQRSYGLNGRIMSPPCWPTLWEHRWRKYLCLPDYASKDEIVQTALARNVRASTGPFHNLFQFDLLVGLGFQVCTACAAPDFADALRVIKGAYALWDQETFCKKKA